MERPLDIGKFQFVVLASLRAAQLIRGCTPRVDGGHKTTVTAQMEVSQGKVRQEFAPTRQAGAEATSVAAMPPTPIVA